MSKHVNTAKNEPLEDVSPTENEGFPGKLVSDGIVVKPGIVLFFQSGWVLVTPQELHFNDVHPGAMGEMKRLMRMFFVPSFVVIL